ncbi:MAG: hypothetical protein ACXACP_12470 [Candidatus Hodarchaeales archaeon]|jgi:hypothetical protein
MTKESDKLSQIKEKAVEIERFLLKNGTDLFATDPQAFFAEFDIEISKEEAEAIIVQCNTALESVDVLRASYALIVIFIVW